MNNEANLNEKEANLLMKELSLPRVLNRDFMNSDGYSCRFSSLSATTLLGTPSDVYLTGTMYWWIVVGAAIAIPSAAYLYLPIFFKLHIISANEVRQQLQWTTPND